MNNHAPALFSYIVPFFHSNIAYKKVIINVHGILAQKKSGLFTYFLETLATGWEKHRWTIIQMERSSHKHSFSHASTKWQHGSPHHKLRGAQQWHLCKLCSGEGKKSNVQLTFSMILPTFLHNRLRYALVYNQLITLMCEVLSMLQIRTN